MKTWLLTLVLLLSSFAYAEQTSAVEPPEPIKWTVGIHLYTYHFDKSAGFNNYNPGAYIEANGWTAGGYYNSEKRASVYAGYTFRSVLGSFIDITVGAVTGYQRASVLPLIVPSVAFHGVRFSLLLPPDKKGSAIHMSYEF